MKSEFFLIISATAISIISLVLILFFIDPFNADYFLLSLFYICLFIGSGGLFFLFGFLLRKKFSHSERLSVSFRQGIFLAAILTSLILINAKT